MEIWKQSVGQYMISNLGRIKSPKRIDVSGHERAEKIIKSYVTRFGYERETGFHRSNICACCRGTQKTAYGFIWSYE